MSDLYTIEQAAQRLDLRLLSETPAEVKVLYGLAFLRLLRTATNPAAGKVYLLQLARRFAIAARGANPAEFLPDEVCDTDELALWMAEQGADKECTEALRDLSTRVREHFDDLLAGPSSPPPDEEADAYGLTVEYYTDAGVPPRGRLVGITVEATRQFRKDAADDVHVINRLIADDRLLKQAVDAVEAARSLVSQRFGVNPRIRHRYDFRLDATLTHLSGNSLGLAFGVAAMCALTRIEPIRTHWQPDACAAYAATLGPDGSIGLVDSTLLANKMVRAFYSQLRYVVVARAQLQEALEILREPERRHRTRRLEVVGVESLSDVVADPRLIRAQRAPLVRHTGRRLAAVKGRYPAAILTALAFLILAWWLFLGRYAVLSFAFRPDGVHAYDRLGFQAWHHREPAGLDTTQYGRASNYQNWLSQDLDHDGNEDLAYMTNSPDRSRVGRLLILNRRGKVLLDTVAFQETAVDSVPGAGRFLHYFLAGLIPGTEEDPILVLCTIANSPAREYWVFMRPTGEVVGRYHSRGYGSSPYFFDIDNDGRAEMVVTVIHNGWERASVYAIKPIGAEGFSPPGPKDSVAYPVCLAQPPGNQLVYYVLPHTDLCSANGLPYPDPWQITKNEEGIRVVTCERSRPTRDANCEACLYWVFSPDLRSFDHLVISDNYWGERQQLVAEKVLPPIDQDSLTRSLESGVMRWDGKTWQSAR